MEGALSLGKVRHGNHHNPQGDEYPEAERCSDQQNLRPLCFPIHTRSAKSQARVCEMPSTFTSAACVQKDRDESASFISGPSEPRFWLAGSLLLSRSASACCAFLNASYSAVPGLGGTPLGIRPATQVRGPQRCPRRSWNHETRKVAGDDECNSGAA